MRIWEFGFRNVKIGFRVQGLGLEIRDRESCFTGLKLRSQGLGVEVQDSEIRLYGFGLSIES